jgi:hypothetical protein
MKQELTPEQEIEQLKTKISEHEETISQQAQVIADQAKSLEAVQPLSSTISETKPKKISIPDKPVNINGKDYVFQVASFRMPGESEIILSEEAILRKEMLETIVNINGQGILKELV